MAPSQDLNTLRSGGAQGSLQSRFLSSPDDVCPCVEFELGGRCQKKNTVRGADEIEREREREREREKAAVLMSAVG